MSLKKAFCPWSAETEVTEEKRTVDDGMNEWTNEQWTNEAALKTEDIANIEDPFTNNTACYYCMWIIESKSIDSIIINGNTILYFMLLRLNA